MAIEVFNRYEKKYLLNEKQFRRLRDRLTDYMEPDEYNKSGEAYTVASLYYDTPDGRMIRESLAKPNYKEKVRIRAYGLPCADSEVYAEIKKKVAGLVNKRRSPLKIYEAYEFMRTGQIPAYRPWHNRQVLNELKYIHERYELQPALYMAYERIAYFGIDDCDLRLSIDSGIRSRRYDLRLEAGDFGEPLLDEGVWLMEIKTGQCIPVWLCRLLSENQVYPAGFSKYGTEYKRRNENVKTVVFDFGFAANTLAAAVNA